MSLINTTRLQDPLLLCHQRLNVLLLFPVLSNITSEKHHTTLSKLSFLVKSFKLGNDKHGLNTPAVRHAKIAIASKWQVPDGCNIEHENEAGVKKKRATFIYHYQH